MTTWRERIEGLRWRGRAMRRLWSPGAQPQMSFLPPTPIPDSTQGRLDHPGAGVVIEDDTIGFGGWVAFERGATAKVEGWLDDVFIGRARIGIERPDIERLKNLAFARQSGFEFSASLHELPEAGQEGEALVRVVATSVEGDRYEFDPVPVVLRPAQSEMPAPAKASPPPLALPRRSPTSLRTLVITHQLTLGGAQLYLLDLLRELDRQGGFEPIVVSTVDGPLRKRLEKMGMPVHITSMSPFEKLTPHLGRVEELTAWAAPYDFEVALVNTATSPAFLGAEVAASLGIPAVWAIHESFPPALLWADLDPAVRKRAEGTVAKAACAVFEADATRRIFERLLEPDRCVTLPYGVDFEPIEAARDSFDQSAAREEAGIPADAELIVCIGTIEPRKAQIQLAKSFELIAAKHPRAHLAFVGGRKNDFYSEELEELIEGIPAGDRIELIPITPDIEAWYGMADVLVCASDVESLPRTMLEAMAWETPVLATSVFGIPELITDGETGWLCDSRDLSALAAALDRVLSTTPEERAKVGAAARDLVISRHDLAEYGRRIAQILLRVGAERNEAGAAGAGLHP